MAAVHILFIFQFNASMSICCAKFPLIILNNETVLKRSRGFHVTKRPLFIGNDSRIPPYVSLYTSRHCYLNGRIQTVLFPMYLDSRSVLPKGLGRHNWSWSNYIFYESTENFIGTPNKTFARSLFFVESNDSYRWVINTCKILLWRSALAVFFLWYEPVIYLTDDLIVSNRRRPAYGHPKH